MKKTVLFLLIILGSSASVMAVPTEFSYSPTPADMYDLDHYRFYTWKINLTSQGYVPGTQITEAYLSFDNINNWDRNANVLHIHLLDTSSGAGLSYGTDNQNAGDKFYNQGILIDNWTDTKGYPGPAEDLVYDFGPNGLNILASLNLFAADGFIAFGIDPDCHYWNDGIEFTIVTGANTIPAPGAILLGGIGVALVGWMRGKRVF